MINHNPPLYSLSTFHTFEKAAGDLAGGLSLKTTEGYLSRYTFSYTSRSKSSKAGPQRSRLLLFASFSSLLIQTPLKKPVKKQGLVRHRINPILPIMLSRPLRIIMPYSLFQQLLMQAPVHINKKILHPAINNQR